MKTYKLNNNHTKIGFVITITFTLLVSAKSFCQRNTMSLTPITFKTDSYEPDENGVKAIAGLDTYLKQIAPEKIKFLILLGHSNCCPKLNIPSFDVNSNEPVKLSNGHVTNLAQAQMADLSFILSIGRMKTVWKHLQNNSTLKGCDEMKKLWLFPAGCRYGNELKAPGNLEDSRAKISVVQIVIVTNDNEEINTNPELPYGEDFGNSPILSDLNKYIPALGYSINKLIVRYLGRESIGIELPDYLELASDPNRQAAWRRDLTN
ncbi:MAG: hypothetical protein OJF59_000628 [Cytophagales bacterium]|nr:MAG: hypothetical protein OJF59_000628 [Cytophagales bacterium]